MCPTSWRRTVGKSMRPVSPGAGSSSRRFSRQARHHDPVGLQLIRSVPGIGKVLSLVILYEIQDVRRFPKVGNFISYGRLVKCAHESAGKKSGSPNNKIGNAHLKWAFSEAAVLFLKDHKQVKDYDHKLVSRYGKSKALSIIACDDRPGSLLHAQTKGGL